MEPAEVDYHRQNRGTSTVWRTGSSAGAGRAVDDAFDDDAYDETFFRRDARSPAVVLLVHRGLPRAFLRR